MRLVGVLALVALVAAGAALAGRGDPKERFTPADQARAKAMLLRQSDFSPVYLAQAAPSGSSGFYCAALDESDLTLTGRGNSPVFVATGTFVRSTVSVYATRANADASWTRGTRPAGVSCLRAALRADLRSSAVQLLSFKPLSFPRRGTRSVAYQAVATVQGIRAYVHLVTMQVGRAEAAVLYVNALAPPPQGDVERITALVATRARKAMRSG
jgi:hypothetical protein